MPVTLKPAIKKDFALTEVDEAYSVSGDEPTLITVRQATQGDHERRGEMFTRLTKEYTANGTRMYQEFSYSTLMRLEVFLTLAGCNITDEETGAPIFKFKEGRLTNEAEFEKTWIKMYPDICRAIHLRVLEMNPTWNGDLGED
jgi:hypothetical protein